MSLPRRSLVRMFPAAVDSEESRPVDAANEAIREFMAARWGRPLWPDERVEYGRLLAAWAAAVRGGVAEAA